MDFRDLKQLICHAPSADPPVPWRRIASIAIGGLTEVGFGDDSELLLVLSSQGRGVFDGATGNRVARDPDENRMDWYGPDRLLARGIGPLEGSLVRLSGLWGGGLSTHTKDGWRVERVALAWPEEHLLLFAPGDHLHAQSPKFTKLGAESEVRAFGFSNTGQTLLIAISSDLTLFTRL